MEKHHLYWLLTMVMRQLLVFYCSIMLKLKAETMVKKPPCTGHVGMGSQQSLNFYSKSDRVSAWMLGHTSMQKILEDEHPCMQRYLATQEDVRIPRQTTTRNQV